MTFDQPPQFLCRPQVDLFGFAFAELEENGTHCPIKGFVGLAAEEVEQCRHVDSDDRVSGCLAGPLEQQFADFRGVRFRGKPEGGVEPSHGFGKPDSVEDFGFGRRLAAKVRAWVDAIVPFVKVLRGLVWNLHSP
jgi:hypothetical protein